MIDSVRRIAVKLAERLLKLGPSDEPVAWATIATEALHAYQASVQGGFGFEDAIVAALIAGLGVVVRRNVWPSKHVSEAYDDTVVETLPAPYFPDSE